MQEQVMVVIRIPIQDLAQDLKLRHSLTHDLFDAKLDGDSLVLSFKQPSPGTSESPLKIPTVHESVTKAEPVSATTPSVLSIKSAGAGGVGRVTRRRKTLKRNRMKTRGWPVVAKVTTSKGQTAVIYKPILDALVDRPHTPAEQRAIVARVLRSNGNAPDETSIEYYLRSTLEYIEQQRAKQGGKA